jgi:hypothetical protein
MQRGCLKQQTRKRGPDVWQFRWSETSLDGKRLHHKKIVGTDKRGATCPFCVLDGFNETSLTLFE